MCSLIRSRHNFCNDCITEHWTVSDTCPMREELFYTRPQLRVNTFISEMSCLVSLASYCETHLGPHLRAPRLKRHRLIDPVDSLEDRVCHETHDVVPLREECERKKVELEATEAGSQQMLQKRWLRIQEVKRSVKISEDEAEGVQVIAALKESVDRGLNELIKEIEDKQATTENPAEDSITELERQISELTTRGTEVEQLSLSEDHLLFLRSLPSPQAAPPTKDWTQVRVRPPSHEGTVVRAASELEETLSREVKKLKDPDLGGLRSRQSQPEGVGVFVDYEQGLVSLRDADAAAHTYSYTCRCFTEKLHPYFCPSNNEGATISTMESKWEA
ncbi:putative E3 ubiquitin/ISG15 ligase TRIM25-like [Scophthalmus maximus]|uniref:Putative E3 ubiquitin/ISG15 ligase TRIM25-like n=1 Tax=Scophthalmus maximus TaxID=52904 RepID=A0A2U9BPA0_SCOMX|nr:putative E3 ubiquitin/ISG15 ligase TRIM25-like [Scophthalmus maximus]